MCTGAAMKIPGSIPWEAMRPEAREREALRIGHPSGLLEVKVQAEAAGNEVEMKSIKIYRTARTIMDGIVYV